MTWKILRLFVNTLTPDDKYSLLNRGILTQHIQMHLSQKQKTFPELLGHIQMHLCQKQNPFSEL